MQKNIYAEGFFAYITDRGLTIGDCCEHCLQTKDFHHTCDFTSDKYTLLAEASKNSIDAKRPFELLFLIYDHTDPYVQQFLYQSVLQFQPDRSPASLIMQVKGIHGHLDSFSGNTTPENAKSFIDILLKDFFIQCEVYKDDTSEVGSDCV